MRAGKNRFRLALQTKSASLDSAGQDTGSFSTSSTVWANVTPLVGRELEEARKIDAEVTHNITMRAGTTVVPKNRFLWGSRIFEVVEVRNLMERDKELSIVCKERI